MDDLPEWAGRAVLASALRAAGLPWVPHAVWRMQAGRMTHAERSLALLLAGKVLAEGRRRLPPGVSGAVLGQEWRDAAWSCIVAGIALLDDEARARLAGHRDDEHELPVAQAEQAVAAEPVAVLKMQPKSTPTNRIRWEGRRRG